MSRTVFIGDVHGCLEELRELVEEKIRPVPGDRIVLLGDLINRGPDSAGVVRYVMGRGFESITGNHEARYLRKQGSTLEKDAWALRLRREIGEDGHRWIAALPAFIEEAAFVAVHAGLLAGHDAAGTLAAPDGLRALTTVRNVFPDGSWTWEQGLPGGVPWWEKRPAGKPVFFGHWVFPQPILGINGAFGLDTGCCFGGALSAYCLETGELFQVKAKRLYVVTGE